MRYVLIGTCQNDGAKGDERTTRSGKGGARRPRDDRRCRAPGRRVEVDGVAGAGGQRAGRRGDAGARLGRDAGLGYIYHRGAATLARRQVRRRSAWSSTTCRTPSSSNWRSASSRPARAARFIPFLANTAENPVRQLQVIRSMREHGAAGLVLAPAIGSSPGELKALVAGLPVVQVMRRLPGLKASLVAPENREGARKATAHLIATGHTRASPSSAAMASMIVREERLAGYRLALEEAGIPFDGSLVIETMPNVRGRRGGGRRSCSTSASPPTAALCFNDVVAIGCVARLRPRPASRSGGNSP